MSPLNVKLWRDLRRMKGQAAAIGMVMAMGVMMQVMMTGLVLSLSETRAAYYERYRLADIFAPVSRAPESVAPQLAKIAGVRQVEIRITGPALIDIPTRSVPVSAQTISLPVGGLPGLNRIRLSGGRMLDPGRADEVLLLHSFAKAHGLTTGDQIKSTINGVRRILRIVGTAQSPEFLYSTSPGELVPDDSRFAVMWMNPQALAGAFDMEGAFNEVLLAIGRDTMEQSVLDEVDRLLKPYGSPGSYGLGDQLSNRFVSEEIAGLKVSAARVPPLFLAVAAFLLYIVVSRMVQSEREEIGLIKAFGYSDAQVGWHYMKFVLIIAAAGALAGCLFGVAAGRSLIGLYTEYYKFPFLVFRLDPSAFFIGVGTSIGVASIGGLLVLKRVFALVPAEAMRPPAPPDFSRVGRFSMAVALYLDQPTRMVLRRLTRQPVRMLGAVIGIAAGMALTLSMVMIYSGFDRTLDMAFNVMDRSDVGITFSHPLGEKAIFSLAKVNGVEFVEPVRLVPVILRNGVLSHRGAISGLVSDAQMVRAIDDQQRRITLPQVGIVLTPALAEKLKVGPGDRLIADIREGSRPSIEVSVAAVATSLMGAPAYMDLDSLNRLLGEPGRASGAYLRIDRTREKEIYATLKDMPAVVGVNLKDEARQTLQEIMDSGAGSIRYVMGLIAFVITFGIVYNAARVAQAERARDLASLRVMGFHTSETAFILLGELAAVTIVALPLGSLSGHFLSFAVAKGFSNELYQIPSFFLPQSHGYAAAVVLVAALVSGWLVKRDLDRTDLGSALKTRE